MDEHSIEAVFSKAVADTYRQFLEAFNLIDDSSPPASTQPGERGLLDTLKTDLAA